MTECCAACRFVNVAITEDEEPEDVSVVMECRRYPPVFFTNTNQPEGFSMAHVAVSGDGWCGEYQPQEDR